MGVLDGFMDLITDGNSDKAAGFAGKAADQFSQLGNGPTQDELSTILRGYVQQGQISPQQAEAFLADPSSMTSISTDPAFKEAQTNALKSLQDLSHGGLSAQDEADLSRVNTEEQTKARGAREAVLQNAAQRGASGGGLELLNQMKANQDAATRTSQRDLDINAQAQNRALAALQGAGSLAGNLQNQEFGQKAQVAGAQDAISKFNASQQQQVAQNNQQANNAAQAANLAAKQSAANSQVDARNQMAQSKTQAAQSVYDNSLKKAAGTAGAYGTAANQASAAGQGLQSLLGSGLTAGAIAFSDKNLKEDVADFDPAAFLDSITGYKYNYKDGHGLPKEKQVGVMAQDVEKQMPQMVEDTPDGKMIDYNKAGGPIFASLADMHRRLKELEG